MNAPTEYAQAEIDRVSRQSSAEEMRYTLRSDGSLAEIQLRYGGDDE